ncbi:hypothetical protein D9M69_506680 [compost metagenome]
MQVGIHPFFRVFSPGKTGGELLPLPVKLLPEINIDIKAQVIFVLTGIPFAVFGHFRIIPVTVEEVFPAVIGPKAHIPGNTQQGFVCNIIIQPCSKTVIQSAPAAFAPGFSAGI